MPAAANASMRSASSPAASEPEFPAQASGLRANPAAGINPIDAPKEAIPVLRKLRPHTSQNPHRCTATRQNAVSEPAQTLSTYKPAARPR